MIAVLLASLLLIGCVEGGQKCTGHPRRYNGKLCGSTTRYHDGHKGACGCGGASGDTPFGWNQNQFIAAANQRYFDSGGRGWCGSKCGQCVKLTTTGGYVDGQGGPSDADRSQIFMVTNLCPAEYPNMPWCAQPKAPWENGENSYGYAYHFDLENAANQINNMGWNNPEVTVEEVGCPGDKMFADVIEHEFEALSKARILKQHRIW